VSPEIHTSMQDYCARGTNPGARSITAYQFTDIQLFSLLY